MPLSFCDVLAAMALTGILFSIKRSSSAGKPWSSVGRTVEDMVGSPLTKFVQPERRAAIEDYLKTIADSGEAQGMLHLEHADGEVRVIAYRNKLIANQGRTPYVLGFVNTARTGPAIIEVPAGQIAGGLGDFWERNITDIGLTVEIKEVDMAT